LNLLSVRDGLRNRGVLVVVAIGVFMLSWVFLSRGFYAHRGTSDAEQYQSWAAELREGQLPYRDFFFPYPPGALAVIGAPIVTGTAFDQPAFVRWFGRLMGVLGLCCVLIAALLQAWRAVAVLALAPLVVGGLIATHFDLWPATLTLAALAALMSDRDRQGWGLLGAAVAAKLYPAVLVPLALAWTFRRQGARELSRCLGVATAVLGAAFGPFVVLAPLGLWKSIYGQISRPLEVESLAASFLKTFGHPVTVGGQWGLVLAGHQAAGTISVAIGIAILGALWIAFARCAVNDADRLVRYAAASVAAFIAFGKVLSPQYPIWLLVLVPLVRGRRGLATTLMLVAVFVATDFISYGTNRFDEYAFASRWAWVELARNLGFVAITAALVAPMPSRERLPALWASEHPETA
jgi:hypothetical protein